MHNPGPAVQKAYAALKEILESGRYPVGSRLPPLHGLARMFHVCKNSVWRAVALAKANGVLQVTKGGYIIAGAPSPCASPAQPFLQTSIWRKTRAALESDIAGGKFSQTRMLPSAKELQGAYGISYSTLKKVLLSLLESGILFRHKGSYRISLFHSRQQRNTIVLLSEGLGFGAIGMHNDRLRTILANLEALCTQFGIALEFVDLSIANEAREVQTRHKRIANERVLGYLLNLPELSAADFSERESGLLAWLVAQRKPVAIFDTTGVFKWPSALFSGHNIRVFRQAGFSAGRQVAKFLLGLGHRRIAYISIHHQHLWSQQRLAGIQDQFSRAGYPGAVVAFTSSGLREYRGHADLLSELPASQQKKIMSRFLSDDGMGFSNESYLGIRRLQRTNTEIGEIKSDFKVLTKLASQCADPDMFLAMRQAAFSMALYKGDTALTRPLLEKALSAGDPTAWVGANDGMAFLALKFLMRSKVDVPGDISVIGFDNAPESFEFKLTAYDFGLQGIVHRMLWFITHPDLRKTKNEPEEIAGVIIERGTTSKAKRR